MMYLHCRSTNPKLADLIDKIIFDIDNSKFKTGFWYNYTWKRMHYADGLSNSCRTICSLLLDVEAKYTFSNCHIGAELLAKYLPLIVEHSHSTLVVEYYSLPVFMPNPTSIYSINYDRFYESDRDLTMDFITKPYTEDYELEDEEDYYGE